MTEQYARDVLKQVLDAWETDRACLLSTVDRAAIVDKARALLSKQIRAARIKRPTRSKSCGNCGATINLNKHQLTHNGEHFCGRDCQQEWLRARTAKYPLEYDSRSSLYARWRGMLARCTNPNHRSFRHYGFRGITVCAEWLTYSSFMNWAISNNYRSDLELDRIDCNRGYSPENCRWATRSINRRNRRDYSGPRQE